MKSKWTIATHNTMENTENNAEQEKPDIKECILINSNCTKFKN